MVHVHKVRHLVGNPHKGKSKSKRRTKKKKSNRMGHKHRKMTAKQIRHFGTKAQKAALKRKRKSARKSSARKGSRKSKSNPRPRKKTYAYKSKSKKKKTSKRRSSNPANLVLTAGALNPRRSHNVAKKRKKSKSHAHRSTKSYKKNRRRSASSHGHTKVVYRYRAKKRKSNGRRRSGYRRNPNLFGHHVSSTEMLLAIAGGLIGVTAAKIVPPMLPAMLTSSPIMAVVVSGAVAFAAGYIGTKVNSRFGDAVLFGGLMQTGSLLLNAFIPSIGARIGLSGLGELMPGRFTVPQNPLRLPPAPAAPAQARIQMNGLQRAYGDAF